MIRFFVFTVAALLAVNAIADDDSERLSHDEARRAVARGEIKPLSEIVRVAEQSFSAPLIEVEFERFKGRYVYELVLLSADGALVELYYDAATAELMAVEHEGGGQELPSLFAGDKAAPWNRYDRDDGKSDSDETDHDDDDSDGSEDDD